MAVALEAGISNLFAKFLADTFVFFCTFQTAGAVATGAFQTLFDGIDHFCVFIQPDSHCVTSFPVYYNTAVNC